MLLRLVAICSAFAAIDVATGLQLLLGGVALVTVLAVGSRQRDKALIADLERSEQRLEKNLAGAAARADEAERFHHTAEKEIAALEREVAVLKQYAAPEAFKEIVMELAAIKVLLSTSLAKADARGLD